VEERAHPVDKVMRLAHAGQVDPLDGVHGVGHVRVNTLAQ
jgi:selenocysteine lyase/cysteine desulfurase